MPWMIPAALIASSAIAAGGALGGAAMQGGGTPSYNGPTQTQLSLQQMLARYLINKYTQGRPQSFGEWRQFGARPQMELYPTPSEAGVFGYYGDIGQANRQNEYVGIAQPMEDPNNPGHFVNATALDPRALFDLMYSGHGQGVGRPPEGNGNQGWAGYQSLPQGGMTPEREALYRRASGRGWA